MSDLTKQITESIALEGKTIERVGEIDNKIFFFFNDDTFVIIRGRSFGDDPDVEIDTDIFDTKPNVNNFSNLYSLSFITEEERDHWLGVYAKNQTDRTENWERNEYERLKQKYG